MITEFLTNENWLNPQINYLLFLEGLRMHIGSGLDGFFMSLTRFGELIIPTMIMCVIYWCINSKAGMYLFALNSFCLFITSILKMSACVYRPWVLTDKIHPVQAAFRTASGYSFPSGHSACVSSSIGGIAYLVRKHKILCTLIVLFILMVGFSRNYLGVHTPQDVIVGLSTGFILIFAIDLLIKWCEKNKNRYLYILVVFNILVALAVYYVCHKNYPMDYINGTLLVNPDKAIYNAMYYLGWVTGLLNGVFLCRRFLPFDAASGNILTRVIRGCVGLLIVFSMLHIIEAKFWENTSHFAMIFEILCFTGFFATGIYPFIFENIEKFAEKKFAKL